MRRALVAFWMLLAVVTPAAAQLSINFGGPGVSIGINLGGYPTLQRIPGYPVYYAPGLRTNYFFYDGLYWVYEGDNWYASSWYNGPWSLVDPMDVPLYVLRVPVRYYRQAPAYFHGWRADEAPRWGEHWGQSWEQRHSGWDQWNRKSAPAPAPLPTYQRQYTGSRYPQASQQAVIETRNYRYQPQDPVARQNFQQRRAQVQSAPQQQAAPQQQTRTQQAPRQQPAQRQEQTTPQKAAPQQQTRTQQAPRQQPAQRQEQTTPQKAAPQQQQQAKPQQQQAKPQPTQQQNQLERKVQQAPPARTQQAPREQPARPQAQERAPQGKQPEKAQGKQPDKKDQGKEKDNKDKSQGG